MPTKVNAVIRFRIVDPERAVMKRARLIKAEAELDAAEQLRQAAEVIMQNPAGLELRRMQMITEVGAEQNTMTIIMMPSEFVSMARNIANRRLIEIGPLPSAVGNAVKQPGADGDPTIDAEPSGS